MKTFKMYDLDNSFDTEQLDIETNWTRNRDIQKESGNKCSFSERIFGYVATGFRSYCDSSIQKSYQNKFC